MGMLDLLAESRQIPSSSWSSGWTPTCVERFLGVGPLSRSKFSSAAGGKGGRGHRGPKKKRRFSLVQAQAQAQAQRFKIKGGRGGVRRRRE